LVSTKNISDKIQRENPQEIEKMIRQMHKSDWEDMTQIYRQSLQKGDVTFATECPSYAEWDAAHLRECRFVCELDGRVVGYTMIAPTSQRAPYRGVAESSIFVDEHCLRKGIGTALLSKLCEESEKCGYWTLYAAIFSINTASIALHKKCGFRVIGYRENIAKDRFGNWQSTTIMERRNQIM
jgi:L-amino acid N-acyltransferase YncA